MSFAGESTRDWDWWRIGPGEIRAKMYSIHEHLRVEMRLSQAMEEEKENCARIPAPNIQKCSQVWLDVHHIRTTRPTWKLHCESLGPFIVVRRVSPYAYELELPASIWFHRVQPISLLDPMVDYHLKGERIDPPPPVDVEGEEENQFSTVEDSWMYRNQLQYLKRWTEYIFLTWEPAKFVDGLKAVGEFHQCYPRKQGPLENVLGGPRT